MHEPEERHPRTGRVEVVGVRVFGRYIPRSTAAVLVAVVLAVTGFVLVSSRGDDRGVEIDTAAAGPVGDEIPTGEAESTTTSTVADTTTSTENAPTTIASTTTSTAKPAAPKPTTTVTTAAPTTTTTVPQPTTCIVMRGSAASGTATTTWVPSANHPGKWDRHTTVTVKNPVAEPATLQGVYVQAANGYLERVFNGIGAPMEAGGTHTFEEISEGYAEKSFTPVGVGGVEFIPSSAPDLFCIADPHGPPFLRDNYAHLRVDPEPNMYGSGSMGSTTSSGDLGFTVVFRTERPFPNLRVHFQIDSGQGPQDKVVSFPRGRVETEAVFPYQTPDGGYTKLVGMTRLEWDGGSRDCILGRESC